jgi:hypothetical protein
MVYGSKIKYLAKYEAQAAAITTKYTDFRLGRNQPPRKAPARGASVVVALASFDTRATTKNTLVKASGRAMLPETRTATGATNAVLNIDTTAPDTAKKVPGYKPAKVTVFIPEEASLTGVPAPAQAPEDAPGPTGVGAADDATKEPLSRVTGLKYSRRLGNSYTYPLGSSATAGQTSEEGMMNYVYQQLSTGGRSLSFESEVPPKPTIR